MSNETVQENLVDLEAQAIPEELVQHTIKCMRVAYCMLGSSANTEPGENLDQVALILAKLSPDDIKELFRLFEVPLLDKEQAG